MKLPEDRSYTDQHEWVMSTDDGFAVGITDYAQDALGDVVYVEVSPAVGDHVDEGDVLAEVESTKSVAEVYAPFSGTVAKKNDDLDGTPELVNQDPYGAGWFVVLTADEDGAADKLLDAAAYAALTE